MADVYFANGRSILHKGSGSKSVAFPDVCLCPPPAPTGPVPTPLPNNAAATDLQDGASSVLIEGNPTGHKESHIATSVGNEVSKPTGGGVVSHATKGKVYFASFSFNVKVEGKGVVRHMDMGTHNHGSTPGNTGPALEMAKQTSTGLTDCSLDSKQSCEISAFKPSKCPPGKTPHHIVPAHSFLEENADNSGVLGNFPDKDGELPGNRALNQVKLRVNKATGDMQGKLNHKVVSLDDVKSTTQPGCENYRSADAPCVCVTGEDKASGAELSEDVQNHNRPESQLQHGWVHRRFDHVEALAARGEKPHAPWTLEKAMQAGVDSVTETMPWCDPACVEKALREFHVEKCGMKEDQPLRADGHGDDWMKETSQLLKRTEKRGPERTGDF
jgi:hypothetical protein